jgi:hypothetical protein
MDKKSQEIFWRDGVVHLKGVLGSEEVKRLKNALEDIFAREDTRSKGGRTDMTLAASKSSGVLDDRDLRLSYENGRYLTEIDAGRWHRGLRDFEFNSSLPSIAGNLLRTKELRFFLDHIFLKEGGSGLQTAMHQDLPYFPFQGDQCAVCWVPVDSVSASSGGMRYVRSSHHWREYSPNSLITNERTHDSPVPMLPSNIFDSDENGTPIYDVIQFDAEPGDVIIHHPRTVHGSSGNISKKRRLAASIRYVGDDIRWLSKPTVVPIDVLKTMWRTEREMPSLFGKMTMVGRYFARRTLRKIGLFEAGHWFEHDYRNSYHWATLEMRDGDPLDAIDSSKLAFPVVWRKDANRSRM